MRAVAIDHTGFAMQKLLTGLLFSLIAGFSTLAYAADEAEKEKIQIAENAPDSYVIQKGDTLWGISGKFLKQPWRWPEVWRLNKDEIRNPHLIYPGQTVYFDRNGPSLSLSQNTGAGGNEKLSPKVYATPAEAPITSVKMDAIRHFLVEPLVSESGDEGGLPSVVAIENDRVLGGPGHVIFAKGVSNVTEQWNIYRRGQPIRNPETQEILAYEAIFLATATTVSAAQGNTAAELKIVLSRHDVMVGDRLVPAAKSESLSYVPHAPAASTKGLVTSMYGGVGAGGRYSVIAVNLGKNDGMEPGHVLGVNRNRGSTVYREDGGKEAFVLPDGRSGLAFVFRVFNRISYALLMEASEPVYLGDKVTAP
ncbi:MAG: LysM peptidoglycan-binding domain-containing protein [Uliginosibacterium sp.]|nr:LysM peptidoglycan-binding domain-containing protein [Uliginosibacterium sp.]